MLDNWRTMGMRGSGSNDIVIEDVEVQDATVSVRRPKGKWHAFFDVAAPIIFPLVVAAYVGVAETAREIAIKQVSKKRDDPIVQQIVGEMDTELETARAIWQQMVVSGTDFKPSLANSDLLFKRKTIAAKTLVRAVDLAMEVVGGGSFFRSVGLERAFRDIQGIRYHPMHERRQYQFSGRVALGIEPS